MKKPVQLKKKTVFIYKSSHWISPMATNTTDPATATATVTSSSTVCIGL